MDLNSAYLGVISVVMHPNANGYPPEDIDVPIPHCGCNALEAKLNGQDGGHDSGSNIAAAIVSTAFGVAQAVTFTGAADFQPGQGGTFDQNWGDSSLQSESDRQTRDARGGTRDKGARDRGSGQQR